MSDNETKVKITGISKELKEEVLQALDKKKDKIKHRQVLASNLTIAWFNRVTHPTNIEAIFDVFDLFVCELEERGF